MRVFRDSTVEKCNDAIASHDRSTLLGVGGVARDAEKLAAVGVVDDAGFVIKAEH